MYLLDNKTKSAIRNVTAKRKFLPCGKDCPVTCFNQNRNVSEKAAELSFFEETACKDGTNMN